MAYDSFYQFKYIDQDESGMIDFDEFDLKVNDLFLPSEISGNSKTKFNYFDPRASGNVSLDYWMYT